MPNLNRTKPRNNGDRFYKSTNSSSSEKQSKSANKVTPKKGTTKNSKEAKCCSAGALSSYVRVPAKKPKKTTKSDLCFNHNNVHKPPVIDYCRKCGDQIDTPAKPKVANSGDADIVQVISGSSSKTSIKTIPSRSVEKVTIRSKSASSQNIPSTSKLKSKSEKAKPCPKINVSTDNYEKLWVNADSVKQYYKNENFCRSSESTQQLQKYLKKISLLDPIKELPETIIDEAMSNINTIYDVYSDSEYSSDDDEIDGDNDSLRKLREFRDDNYFETHSAESRVKSKGSVTSLVDHECVYRFYLNDRLFPVPLNSDQRKTIRCTECYLPLDMNKSVAKDINGTIQAKVKLGKGDKAQDMVLMLPVKEPLIIEQKIKEPKEEDEVVYFGVIKLDNYGNSMFNKTLPIDSLALKYQKGYREFEKSGEEYEYKKSEECDVIVI